MIIFQGERVGCENCIRGHRAADCLHIDKHLISIRGRGRPTSRGKISIRYRLEPGLTVVRKSYEEIENKNRRGSEGSSTTKLCYHLDDNTPVKLYKVKLGTGFKVIGPVLPDEVFYKTLFNLNVNQNLKIVPPTDKDIMESNEHTERLVSHSPVKHDRSPGISLISPYEDATYDKRDSLSSIISSDFSRVNSLSTVDNEDITEDSLTNIKNEAMSEFYHSHTNKKSINDEIYGDSFINGLAFDNSRTHLHGPLGVNLDIFDTSFYHGNNCLNIQAPQTTGASSMNDFEYLQQSNFFFSTEPDFSTDEYNAMPEENDMNASADYNLGQPNHFDGSQVQLPFLDTTGISSETNKFDTSMVEYFNWDIAVDN